MPPPEPIVISGMVGLGKTTLTRALANHYGCPAFLEPVGAQNPWLARCDARAEGRRANWLPFQLAFIVRQIEDQDLLRKTGWRAITDKFLDATPEVYWKHTRTDTFIDPEAIDMAERIDAIIQYHIPRAHRPFR